MDRIFYNTRTGETVLSRPEGMMPANSDWIQIGTVDMTKVLADMDVKVRNGFRGVVMFK